MRVKIKICGVTTHECVAAAVREGADAVGFVFAKSPRRVTVEHAATLAKAIPPFVTKVAVTRNPERDQLDAILSGFRPDVLQSEPNRAALQAVANTNILLLPVLHDDGTLEQQLADLENTGVPVQAILLEGPGRGGRGIAPERSRAAALAQRAPLVLAGGLTPENVASAIQQVRPYAVDVSSGVESAPGMKRSDLIAQFVSAVREAEHTQRISGVS